MTAPDLIDRLAEHKTLRAAPRTELEWLVAHGSIRNLNAGDVLSAKGVQVEFLHIVLSGRLALFVDRGAGLNKMVEWQAGDVTGMLPYSRLLAPPGDVRTIEAAEILAIPRACLKDLTRECFEITSIFVHSMLDRSRLFTTSELQDEKMLSLGKLSAGLAHELNNPASAIERCAAMLEDRIDDSEHAARGLASSTLTEAQVAAIEALRASCMARSSQSVRSSLEQMDREEAIADWLASHKLDTTHAAMLADTEVNFETLNLLAAGVEQPSLDAAIRWAAAGCSMRNLASKIQDSSMHISSLIGAVKGYTHMDKANTAGPVDLVQSLAHTVAVLKSKAREKSVTVTLELHPDLPMVRGFTAELNQVWGNLIDNALDAVPNEGKVEVFTSRDDHTHTVEVRIRDNGPGIPAELRDRVFDPFFTTKPQGQGIGLGLDIARRLTRHNDGTIDFDSTSAQTEFRVRLPIAES